ncbi:MAG TPA: ECF-type sigma factor [Candidatus Sulfopaludibacter sp.]|nr:ECF-type sigma factor [Candidatus Sulfopaludibacter sp.]
MGIVPTQSVGDAVPAGLASAANSEIAPALLDELWRACEPEACALTRAQFEQILLGIGIAQNFGLQQGLAAQATPSQQAAFFSGLRLADLVLARACAAGSERAWERFIALYREALLRAGVAITGNESLGRELADGLYAELYGLTVREGERRCPLDSYAGRGSLLGWLRTTLAQRHVDHHRRTHREQPLDESGEGPNFADAATTEPDPAPSPLLASAVEEALDREGPEEKFLLASYYLDGRRLHEIAALLGVHEATVSRKLKRVTASVRKQIVLALERRGLSRRAAEEALATDPRDLTGPDENDHLRLKELLQSSQPGAFKEKA